MVWFCQPVALAISAVVAPSFRRRSSKTTSALLPSRDLDFFLDSAAVAIFFVARSFRRGPLFSQFPPLPRFALLFCSRLFS